MILNVKRSAMSNLYPIYRQYYKLCNALFVASLVERCSVEPKVWGSSRTYTFLFFLFVCFIESIKLSHLQAILLKKQ